MGDMGTGSNSPFDTRRACSSSRDTGPSTVRRISTASAIAAPVITAAVSLIDQYSARPRSRSSSSPLALSSPSPCCTAPLAVPEPLLSRLMLAAQAGTLRLAVRSAEEQLLSRYWAGENDAPEKLESANRDLYQFTQLALTGPPKRIAPAGGGPAVPRGIEVIRGAQSAPQTLIDKDA